MVITRGRFLNSLLIMYFALIMLLYINFLSGSVFLGVSYLLLIIILVFSYLNVNVLLAFLCISIILMGFNSGFSFDALSSLKLFLMYIAPFYILTVAIGTYREISNIGHILSRIIILLLKIYACFVIFALLGLLFGTDIPNSFAENGLPMKRLTFLGLNLDQVAYGSWPFVRVGGVIQNPNTFGMIGVVLIMTSFAASGFEKSKCKLLLILALMGIILSFSRASILTLFIFYIFYLLFNKKYKKLFTSGVLIVLVVGLFVAVSNIEFGSRLSLSLNSRDIVWGVLLESLYQKPYFGIGLGGAANYLLVNESIKYPHNFHLTMLVELGLFGAILIYILFLYGFFLGVKGWMQGGSMRRYYSAYLAFYLAFMIGQFFENFLFSNIVISSLFFLLIAITMRLQQDMRNE